MLTIKTCPTCGSKDIRKVLRSIANEHNGERIVVPRVPCWECPSCGERLFDREGSRRIDAAVFGRIGTEKRRRTA
jgi:YgiT-type zinc finger domain-containing protein